MTDRSPDAATTDAAGPAVQGAPAPLDHLAELFRVQDAFQASIGEVDPEARVPWCRPWRVRDLVVHLARIHHWAASQAARTAEVPLGRGPFDLPVLYATCAAELRQTLTDLGPDAVSSTLVGLAPATFWHRRQLHESLVHLWDLRTAGGLPLDLTHAGTSGPVAAAVPAVVWADTVDEAVNVMHPRQVRLERMAPLTVPVLLLAEDAGRRWVLGPDAEPVAVVRGTAQDLALLLWRRTAVPGAEAGGRLPSTAVVLGDLVALTSVLEQPITP